MIQVLSEAVMMRTTMVSLLLLANLLGFQTVNPQEGGSAGKPPKPGLSVDEARMIVKDIPSVNIQETRHLEAFGERAGTAPAVRGSRRELAAAPSQFANRPGVIHNFLRLTHDRIDVRLVLEALA